MQHKRSKKDIEYCEYLSLAIKALREESGKSLNCTAFDSGLSPSTLSRIENNTNSSQITKIAQVAQGLNIPLSTIILKTEEILPKDFQFDNE